MLGAMYTGLTISLCQLSEIEEMMKSETFYYAMKCIDMLIGQFLMLLFGWNMYVMLTGYTHIEFKNMYETQVHNKNNEMTPENQKRPTMVLYQYGFQTGRENFIRVFGTDK